MTTIDKTFAGGHSLIETRGILIVVHGKEMPYT